jgi:hypothetical protein
MKTLLVLLSVLALNLSISARPPHEKTGSDIYDYNQVGKIHAAMLNSLDEDIYTTQIFFDQEIANMTETNDFTEGKIRAAMVASIGNDLLKVKEARANLEDRAEILDADVEPLHNKLSDIRKIIDEINIQ